MNDLSDKIQEVTAAYARSRNNAIEEFLLINKADPATQELAYYFESDTFALVPKGSQLPLAEALKYPHLNLGSSEAPSLGQPGRFAATRSYDSVAIESYMRPHA